MTRIYISIAISGLAFIAVSVFQSYTQEGARGHTMIKELSATETLNAIPDRLMMTLERRDVLNPSPAETFRSVSSVVRAFKDNLNVTYVAWPITSTSTFVRTFRGIARSFEASGSVSVYFEEFGSVKEIIETALRSGVNSVSEVRFFLSPKMRAETASEARAKAYESVKRKAEEIARLLNMRYALIGDSAERSVVSGGALGDGGGQDGKATDAITTELKVVEIRTLMRTLNELTLAEPSYDGAVVTAQTLVPSMIQVPQTVSVNVEYFN